MFQSKSMLTLFLEGCGDDQGEQLGQSQLWLEEGDLCLNRVQISLKELKGQQCDKVKQRVPTKMGKVDRERNHKMN